MSRSFLVERVRMAHPADLTGLEALVACGRIVPKRIVALWCKTEGNGLANDFTRDYGDLVLRQALAQWRGTTAAEMGEACQIIVSGGSEGVIEPHLIIVAESEEGDGTGLAGALVARHVPQAALGAEAHAELTASMVREAAARAGLVSTSDVALAVVKTPTPSLDFRMLVAARVAAAVGVARAIGAVADSDRELAPEADGSHRAFVVARPGDIAQQVLVLGNAGDDGAGRLRIASGPLNDTIDAPGVARVLSALALNAAPQLRAEDSERLVAILVKGDAPPRLSGGRRHTMHDDPTLPMFRQARSVYGTLVAAVTGQTQCLVSGGAERHGPRAGGSIAIIARTPG